ncbi:MAG: CPBP family intramembrane metalloprotease [Erysipelotrichaceae bacterium]|nr:CPBP family intramembrane metalloprotease [Erysipelotrichaceae bacterium]
MKELIKKITRQTGTVTDTLPFAAILSFLATLLGMLLSLLLFRFLPVRKLIDILTGDAAITDFALQYFEFVGIWIFILLLVFVFKKNRKMWNGLRYNGKGNSFRSLLFGALLGFLTNGICVLISWLSGDIKLSFYGFDIRFLLVFVIVVFVQSGAEELVDRFYLYQKLRRRYRSPLVAILGNALVFALMHGLNPGFTFTAALQIFLVAMIFSMFVYYYDALWMAMAFHASWNFTQNIIFGLPNSGLVSAYSIFHLEAASARNGLFYNVGFGVEGSIGACLILFVLVIVIYLLNRNKAEKNDLWAEETEWDS